MPPLDFIEVSDDDRAPIISQAAPHPRQLPALAVVADLNLRIEEVTFNIKSYKDDIASLKELLQSAEERLKKEQEKWSRLIDAKDEALNSGVREINARGSMVKVKKELEQELEPRIKAEKSPSVFMGVQVPLKNGARVQGPHSLSKPAIIKTKPEPPPAPPPVVRPEYHRNKAISRKQTPQITQTNEHWDDEDSDYGVLMGDYSTEHDDDNLKRLRRSVEDRPHGAIHHTRWNIRMVHRVGKSRGLIRRDQDEESITVRDMPKSGIATPSLSLLGGNSSIPWNSKAFSREIISSAIGGQLQHTWPTPDSGGDYQIKIERYCCLRRELNWCLPSGPGKGGFMFSSKPVGHDLESFPLFIREHSSKWIYYGDYKIGECRMVSSQEWRCFNETQKSAWCKHMLTREWGKSALRKHIPEKELESMGSGDWKKIERLYATAENNPQHLRITCRALEFLRYNKELYTLLEGKSLKPISNPSLSAAKRKIILEDVEIDPSLAHGEYVGRTLGDNLGDNDDDSDVAQPGRKRTRRNRNRASYIATQETLKPRFKVELLDSDEDMYSAPNPHPFQNPQPSQAPQALASSSIRGSNIEVYERIKPPWVPPTEDNDRIAASDDWAKKFDANQLIKVWNKHHIPDLPWPTIKFTRKFLSKVIGGGEQMVQCVISEAKQKTQIYPIKVYYCERAEWSPDLPKEPGAHGVVYATAPHLKDTVRVDLNFSNYAIFCRRAANQWDYCGEYEITRRKFLPGEWSRISPVAKKSWSEGFAGKKRPNKWGRDHLVKRGLIEQGQKITPEEVLKFIDDGLLVLECQIYKCVGYKRDFYETLKDAWLKEVAINQLIKEEEDEEE